MPATPDNTTALLLAGGQGRRMGGKDKGLLPYGDSVLAAHILRAIAPQVASVMVNANRHRADYARFGWPVVADPLDGFQGPLAGLLGGLEAAPGEYVVTLPCDGPHVAPDFVRRLAAALNAQAADIAVAHDGSRLQPVHALVHRSLAAGLRDALAAGERKIDRWYAANHWVTADFSDFPQQFDNFNTPEQYQGGVPRQGGADA
jgi:molybdopterin-guanine dinucleotide biosynthesis protein A